MTILGVFTPLHLLILCAIIYAMASVHPFETNIHGRMYSREPFKISTLDMYGVPILVEKVGGKTAIVKFPAKSTRDQINRLRSLHNGENTPRPKYEGGQPAILQFPSGAPLYEGDLSQAGSNSSGEDELGSDDNDLSPEDLQYINQAIHFYDMYFPEEDSAD